MTYKQAYTATAEIVSAYTDERLGTARGLIEIERDPATGATTVTATFGGHEATRADTTDHHDEIHALMIEATHAAAIATGDNPGCQIGTVYLEGEAAHAAA